MCGIAGCYQQADGHKLTDVMTERIAHRGPDSGATWGHEDERASIHLGHRRLSIIDLSTSANQPFVKGSLALGDVHVHGAFKTGLIKVDSTSGKA